MGHGPQGTPKIDPEEGAPQADIFYHYKHAQRQATALDRATKTEEKAARRENRIIDPENIDRLYKRYLTRLPYKANGCRYHSFVVYFSNLQRLGWVEPSGMEQPSELQTNYPPAPPRRFYRLTEAGRHASDIAWQNPYAALY